MTNHFNTMDDQDIFAVISKDFESSDGQSRWEDIPEQTKTEILKDSFTDKTDAELFAEIAGDFDSSDGQTRYKNCGRKTTKKATAKKTINKSNKGNTMTKITLSSGKVILVESNHAVRLQKSIAELSDNTRARVNRAAKRLQNKDSFVASIKNNGARTYNQLASWINTTHSDKEAVIHANDKDRIVYSV